MTIEDVFRDWVPCAPTCEEECDANSCVMYATLAELKALREQVKTALERALDEVAAYLRAESNRYLGADEHHERAEAFHVAAEEVAAGQFRTAPDDPELARLEREVARAAVAYDHAVANNADWLAPQQAYQRASTALRAFIIDGKGEAK